MSVGVLLLASLQDILSGGGRQSIEVLFASTASAETFGAACALSASLDEAGWGLFQTAVLPHALSSTARHIAAPATVIVSTSPFDVASSSPVTNSLTLLARLAHSGRIYEAYQLGGHGIAAWERVIGEASEARIKEWTAEFKAVNEADEAKVSSTVLVHVAVIDARVQNYELLDVLILIPHIPNLHPTFLPLVADLISTVARTSPDVARAAFLDSPVSPAQILGSALVAFSKIASTLRKKDEKIGKILSNSVLAMIEGFAWHRSVMHGIASLQLTVSAADDSPETQERIYNALLPNLLSEDSLLRLSSLQIASSIFPATRMPVAADLIAKCIEVEQMPLSVQGAREKSMKLRKLGIVANGQLGRDGEDTTRTLEIILRYLTGQSSCLLTPSTRY